MAESFQDIFGQTPGQVGLGAAGTFAGGALNYFFNSKLQENQFKEQERLQDRAFQYNNQAALMQAQNQAHGLMNAGLSPAQATGAGAPSLQAGAAAGANSQLASIFQGVAEIVAAAKAPSEVENTQADTGLKKADTGLKEAETGEVQQRVKFVNPAMVDKIRQETDKLFQETRNAENVNDAWEAKDNFVKAHAPAMFEQMRAKLQKDGTWNTISEKTRETIDALADGTTEVGLGGLEGLQDLVKSQLDLSDADARTAANAFNLVILDKQLKSPEVMEAIASLPKTQQDEMKAHIKKMNQEILGIMQDIQESAQRIDESKQRVEESKSQVELNKANKELAEANRDLSKANTALTNFQREVEELDSPHWLWKHGRKGDAVQSIFKKAAQHAGEMQKAAAGGIAAGAGAGVAGGLVGGKAVGKAVGKAADKAVDNAMKKPNISIQKNLDHSNPYSDDNYWNTFNKNK